MGRRVCRQLAVALSVALFAFDPALADEATPEPPAEAASQPAAEPAPQPAAVAPDAPQTSTASQWADYGAKAFDVFPIRLLSSCATIVGFGAFIASVPLVGPGGQLDAIRGSWDYFVMGPVDYTFVRPLGDF